MSEPDIGPEETAQKEAIPYVVALLGERELKEVQDITRALARIELVEYGRCEGSGEEIETKRLETILRTSVCNKHKRTE